MDLLGVYKLERQGAARRLEISRNDFYYFNDDGMYGVHALRQLESGLLRTARARWIQSLERTLRVLEGAEKFQPAHGSV
jgi:hypothetical protein